MSLLPEQSAANYLNPLLDAANESGLPVWREIDAAQARKFILGKVQLADVLTVDHQLIHDSYLLAARIGKFWGPWYLGDILLERRKAAWQAKKEQASAEANSNQNPPQMIQTNEQQDQRTASEMKKAASMAERLEMVRWAQRQTGRTSIGVFAAFLTRVKYESEKEA